jgi:ubiquinone/menaquinone biosynthesis C-methylase UbiE
MLQGGTMRQRKEGWDAAAKKDAIYYIPGGKDWTKEEFFASGIIEGEKFTKNFFSQMNFNPSGKRMLDIGCGVGRMTRAFADMFGEAYGVDFSDEMITRAREFNKDEPNLFFMTNNGVDLSIYEDNFFDFCFSFVVFQHIPDAKIIESHISEISRVLRPGGLFKFQVDGRRWAPVIPIIHRSLYNLLLKVGLVDKFAKLRFRRDTIKQKALPTILLSKAKLHKMLRSTSLEVVEITGEDTYQMWCSGKKRQ